MRLEVQVGGEQLQVAVADVLGKQRLAEELGAGRRPGPAHPAWPGAHLAVLEPQLHLGVVHHLAQAADRHPAPAPLEHAQERLLQALSLALQAREVLRGAELRVGGLSPGRTRPRNHTSAQKPVRTAALSREANGRTRMRSLSESHGGASEVCTRRGASPHRRGFPSCLPSYGLLRPPKACWSQHAGSVSEAVVTPPLPPPAQRHLLTGQYLGLNKMWGPGLRRLPTAMVTSAGVQLGGEASGAPPPHQAQICRGAFALADPSAWATWP